MRQVTDKVAKEVFLVQTEGGDVGTQDIPLGVQSCRDLCQGSQRPWHRARNACGFDYDPWNKLPTLDENLQATTN